ncbi:MAG: acyl-CoA desaturase [Patescibacteria group bacterium]
MIGSNKSELVLNERMDLFRSIPFLLIHLVGLIGPFYVGFSWIAFSTAVLLYFVRMFFVTGFIHRYFSHKTFEIILWPRFTQWMMAFLSTMVVQKGVVWWASHHRQHHAHSDDSEDVHSNYLRGFFWSHVGWIMCPKYHQIDESKSRDWMGVPEIMWLEKGIHHMIGPVFLAIFCAWFGWYIGDLWNTNALQMLVWAFFTSTVALYHGTFLINSAAHMFGKKRYETGDYSRNSLILAIITLGEGWHNNHHYNQHRAAQAVTPLEYCFDWTYWGLKVMDFLGIIRIKKV